jgi:phosphoribosyl 1,2-cyclic phosphodiesterase
MEIQPLASGSKGNSVLISTPRTRILLDAGLKRGELQDRLDSIRLRIEQLDAIVVSHGHADHSRSVASLSRRGRIPVYAAMPCLERIGESMLHRAVPISTHGHFEIGDIRVEPFRVMHDAPETLGFRFSSGGASLGYCTDLGSLGGALFEKLRLVDGLYLEFNHDLQMLREGPYDRDLKRRVEGQRGHLSNEQAAEILRRVAHPGLRVVYLAHLSQVNNRPELALEAARAALARSGCSAVCVIALQDQVSPAHTLSAS